MKCQHCGHKLTPGAAFCGNCGTPVPINQPAAVPLPPNAAVAVPTPPPSPQIAAVPLPQMPGPSNPFAGQVSDKDYLTTFLLAFFLGFFGVDRFYTGQVGLGIAKLLLSWLTLGIWPLVDVIIILAGGRKDKFGRPLYGRDKNFKASMIIFLVLSGLVVVGNVAGVIIAVVSDHSDSSSASSQSSTDDNTQLVKPLGSAITLYTSDNDKFEMTAVRIDPNAQAADPSEALSAPGKHFVAVELKIVNNGSRSIAEDASTAAQLLDSTSHAYAVDYTEMSGCPSLPNEYISLQPGETLNGCVTFVVPNIEDITRFRFTPDSEYADQGATWDIK